MTGLLTTDCVARVLGFALGNGWFRGRLGWSGGRGYYGDELGVLAQLEITYADGHVQRIVTDTDWTAGPSAVTANDLYDGQDVDARLELRRLAAARLRRRRLGGRAHRRA